MAACPLPRRLLLSAALAVGVAASTRELPTVHYPLEGTAVGPDTYLADAGQVSCAALAPYPEVVPFNPTVDEAKAFCSGDPGCGGFVYTSAATSDAAGGANQASAVYCKPRSFVAGDQSATSGVSFVRRVYDSCDVRLTLPATTAYFHGFLSHFRGACARPARGTAQSARTRSPRPNAERRGRAPPRKLVSLGGSDYEVGVEVFVAEAQAVAVSASGEAHLMQTDYGVVDYYMPGSTHNKRGEPLAIDGFYPLYARLTAAQAASAQAGGNGAGQAVGPNSAHALPLRWSRAPHVQTYYMPADGPARFLGNYPTAFAQDGYYPLYRSEADAQTVSTNGAAVSYGPGSSAGHPKYWTNGQKEVYHMPAAGHALHFGSYNEASLGSGLYGVVLKHPAALEPVASAIQVTVTSTTTTTTTPGLGVP